jgi:hypothetical protein
VAPVRRLLATLFLLALVPATARADWLAAPTPPSVASAHWPDSACHGRELVHLVPQATIDGFLPQDPTRTHTGYTPGGTTCDVFIADWVHKQPVDYCSLLVHEFGHLAGFEHSLDPTDVMYGGRVVTAPECRQFPATLRGFRMAPRRRKG